jgi:predicted DNA-binding transcriptional regulator YafY
MPRTDRLLKLLAILQDVPGLTAEALAARCAVSRRTAHRDLAVLADLGFPLRFDTGYRLAAQELLPPVPFAPEEAMAARLALAGRDDPAARSAAAKLAALDAMAAVPSSAPAGPQLPLALGPVADPAATSRLTDLHRAVAERRVARIAAARGGRPGREIALEPYRILFARGHWWVVGYAPARRRAIALAADRIRAVIVTGRRFREREGVRLERFLARLGPGTAPPFAATVRLGPGAVPLAAGVPSRWLKNLEMAPDGSARLTLAAPQPELLVAWVIALGDAAEVLEPRALRADLARRGRALAQRYAPA